MQTVWVFFSQEVEEQSHSNQEILRLTYIHPKTCHDENVIQNLREKEGGEDNGGGGGRKFWEVISKNFFLEGHE